MLQDALRRLLELYPKGASDAQLLWRLKSVGARAQASDILDGLKGLTLQGECHRDPTGRWISSKFKFSDPTTKASGTHAGGSDSVSSEVLYAAPARTLSIATRPFSDQDFGPMQMVALPPWPALLAYYAATQRQDPRGRIVEYSDRHGYAWQLFRTSGHWWTDAEIHLDMSSLPETFREALTRRSVRSAAVGWPICLFETELGLTFVPALLLPMEWSIELGLLRVRPVDDEPSLNPEFIRNVRRVSGRWSEAALKDALFPEGEERDLGTVGERMKHALATLGGGALKAADLAGEMTLGGTGLRNVAALHLPEDGTFTRATAEDLETLGDWSQEKWRHTALEAVLSGVSSAPDEQTFPIVTLSPLSERQMEAADAGVSGPLTVIQGPPGTGKSEIILTLIISALLSGRSVLFASRNHQALNEVEGRLKQIVSDHPVLTRGRDAEGERDTNFWEALTEIAKADNRQEIPETLKRRQTSLIARAKEAAAARSAHRERSVLHRRLCDLIDIRDGLRLKLTEEGSPDRSITQRLIQLLRRLLLIWRSPRDRVGSLTERDVRADIRSLRKRLGASIAAELDWTDEFRSDLQSSLIDLTEMITRPDKAEWQWIANRVKELEFAGVRSARKLSAEDAQLVVRHRPIWAVSTLSVPSRIPLVPGLFDLVIFDEASQCDIASSLPLFVRAKKAIVVGDPEQLSFVPSLGKAAENALMDATGLPTAGRAHYAQSINSLFDFAVRRTAARRVFLKDQFRSAPSIVSWLNEEFYKQDGLEGRREADHFKPPSGYKAGLFWEDVPNGSVERSDGGNVNRVEADRIAELIGQLARNLEFQGSVGVLAPFNAQVAAIQQAIQRRLPELERERIGLRISTIDKFQGGEADVIFFSMTITRGAPPSAIHFIRKERRRLNVAVSRARALCIVVGDLRYARECDIPAVRSLARRSTEPWSPPRPPYDSLWERRLAEAMRGRGFDPIPQHPVGTRYLDFALDPDGARIDIEVDGRQWHLDADGNRKAADRMRDSELTARGWMVIRFWVHELDANMGDCLDHIGHEYRARGGSIGRAGA